MDDEVEEYPDYGPARYDKWSFIGLGLNFTSRFFDGVSDAYGTLAVMAIQHRMQQENDRKFKEIVSGK